MSNTDTSNISEAIRNDVSSLRPAIHLDLTRMCAQRLGYDFLTEERLKRISDDSMAMMDDHNLPFPYAFSEAVCRGGMV